MIGIRDATIQLGSAEELTCSVLTRVSAGLPRTLGGGGPVPTAAAMIPEDSSQAVHLPHSIREELVEDDKLSASV